MNTKLIVITAGALLMGATVVTPKSALAAEQVCTQSYGQPVVCGVTSAPIVKAGIGDVSLKILGAGFLAASGVSFLVARKRGVTSF